MLDPAGTAATAKRTPDRADRGAPLRFGYQRAVEAMRVTVAGKLPESHEPNTPARQANPHDVLGRRWQRVRGLMRLPRIPR